MKILYSLTSLSHKRVVQSFVHRVGIEQIIVGPKTIIFDNIVPEDYSEFGIKNVIEYSNTKEIQAAVNTFVPDVYVQADLSPMQKNIVLPSKCKRVYVSHGLVPNYAKDIKKHIGVSNGSWNSCDLYCGGTKIFENWIKSVVEKTENKILLNALPQLDILYELKNRWSNKLREKNII